MPPLRKAVIFAAGLGSRLGPHTKDLPKTLLKIGQLTIFDRAVLGLHKMGIDDIAVVIGYSGSKLRDHALSTTSDLVSGGVKFSFIENNDLDKGNIYSLWLAGKVMNEDFVLLNSDVVFHYGVLDFLRNSSKSMLLIDDTKVLGAEEMKVRVTGSDDGGKIIKDITKKMEPSTAYGEYIGITRVSITDMPLILETTKKLLSGENFPLYYEDAFRAVAKDHNRLFASSTRGLPWTEIDTVEDMIYARDTIVPQLDIRGAKQQDIAPQRI